MNTAGNRATGRKMRPITNVAITALGEEEMAVRLQALREEYP
jgi:hypothetical protein